MKTIAQNNLIALITGTNRGLGKFILLEFIKRGINVIAHARKNYEIVHNQQKILFSDWCKQLSNEYHVLVQPIFFDLLDLVSIKNEMQKLLIDIDIDILINNAGIGKWKYFQFLPIDEIRKTMDVNLFAPMLLTQLILPSMLMKNKGHIINISSEFGLNSIPGNTAYGTSKAALIAFTKNLAVEYGQFNIHINSIAPGMMDTDFINRLNNQKNKYENTSPMKRLCTTQDVLDSILFLISEQSSYINGQVILLNGGRSSL